MKKILNLEERFYFPTLEAASNGLKKKGLAFGGKLSKDPEHDSGRKPRRPLWEATRR